jgi:hypothetical protein
MGSTRKREKASQTDRPRGVATGVAEFRHHGPIIGRQLTLERETTTTATATVRKREDRETEDRQTDQL